MREQLKLAAQLKGQIIESMEKVGEIVFLLLEGEKFTAIIAEYEYDDLTIYITSEHPFSLLEDWELQKLVEYGVVSQDELEDHRADIAARRYDHSITDLKRRAELLGFRLEKDNETEQDTG